MERERSRSPNEERWFGYVRRLFRRLQQLQDRVEFLEGTVTQLMQEQRDLHQLFRQQHTWLLAQQHQQFMRQVQWPSGAVSAASAPGGTFGGGSASAMLPAPAPAAGLPPPLSTTLTFTPAGTPVLLPVGPPPGGAAGPPPGARPAVRPLALQTEAAAAVTLTPSSSTPRREPRP